MNIESEELVFPWKIGDQLEIVKCESWSSVLRGRNPINCVRSGDIITITNIEGIYPNHIPFKATFEGVTYGFAYNLDNEYKLKSIKNNEN